MTDEITENEEVVLLHRSILLRVHSDSSVTVFIRLSNDKKNGYKAATWTMSSGLDEDGKGLEILTPAEREDVLLRCTRMALDKSGHPKKRRGG